MTKLSILELIRNNQLDEGVRLGQSNLISNPDDFDNQYALGLAYLLQEKYSNAISHLSNVWDKRPRDFKCAGNLGVAYLRLKQYDEAIQTLEQVLEIAPNYLEAKYNLGCAYLENANSDRALELFFKLQKQDPNDPNIQCAIGDVYRSLNNWQSAIKIYQEIIVSFPNFQRAHLNLGPILLQIGKFEKAKEHCENALKLDPRVVQAHSNLADCLVHMELLDEAMEHYANAFEISPTSPDLCVSIGKVWQETGDEAEAYSWFQKAIHHNSNHIEAKCRLMKIIADSGDTESAISTLEPLLIDNPDDIELNLHLADIYWTDGNAYSAMEHLHHVNELQPNRLAVLTKIASILNSSGDTDLAIDFYKQALNQNSYFVPALNGLATSQKAELAPSQAELMEKLLSSNQNLRKAAKASLHNGLAFYYDSQTKCHENLEKAAFHMQEANNAQWDHRTQRDWEYQNSSREKYISTLIKTFTSDYFEEFGNIGDKNAMPIFIVGMPRSGTTLTEQILSRHSKILGIGERQFASQSFQKFTHNSDLNDTERYLGCLNEKELLDSAKNYLNRLNNLLEKSDKREAQYVVDKMPDNYALIGWILTLYPNAKIIHAKRDVRDIALSCWMTQFGSIPWACKTHHISHRIAQYQRIMHHWEQILNGQIFESNYEDLVKNQEVHSRALVEFIGLEWEEQCLNFYESDRLIRTASVTQVRQPIYKKSVAKWEQYSSYVPELFSTLKP